jgi:hypothetical protein
MVRQNQPLRREIRKSQAVGTGRMQARACARCAVAAKTDCESALLHKSKTPGLGRAAYDRIALRSVALEDLLGKIVVHRCAVMQRLQVRALEQLLAALAHLFADDLLHIL